MGNASQSLNKIHIKTGISLVSTYREIHKNLFKNSLILRVTVIMEQLVVCWRMECCLMLIEIGCISPSRSTTLKVQWCRQTAAGEGNSHKYAGLEIRQTQLSEMMTYTDSNDKVTITITPMYFNVTVIEETQEKT